ncbi:NUDIX hydrolase [Paucibacter sediminis]|uniref:NUDIX hydrolase n=1 Tax=Paucibacter sediminis TaxID=3019553 RepID=A0AA95SQM8_9BURK|nr:NUDIX hydrolase [Paucibacter sp. S2-9]WIT13625.1 NUDIX hydrolase [Paucibacter sp. S2-9]
MRQQIYSEIEAIVPLDALEVEHRADALAWVESGVELCRLAKPATPPKHLVSYFAVVDGESILLVDHKNAQLWLPSGGHVEPGEHPRNTVARELVEELRFKASHEIGPPLMITLAETVGLTAGHTDVSLWYVVRAERGQVLKYDEDEFNGVSWFSFSDVPFGRTDPHMHRFIQKLRPSQSLEPTRVGRPPLAAQLQR